MVDGKLVRHLKVLTEKAETGAVPSLKLFSIGDPAEVEGEGEVVPLIAWIDDNLSRYVVSNASSSTWGASPAFIRALPNRAVRKKDALFLLSSAGEDRDEPHPTGEGKIHFIHLGAPGRLWAGSSSRLYIYKLDAVQTRAMLAPKGA